MREFELLGTGEDKPNPLLLERLKACAAVIDALGYKARHWASHPPLPTALSSCGLDFPLTRGLSAILDYMLLLYCDICNATRLWGQRYL